MYAIEVYTDGIKTGDNVGSAGIIFVTGKLVHQLKFKLHGQCYNNQAEQIANFKDFRKIRPTGWKIQRKTCCNIH